MVASNRCLADPDEARGCIINKLSESPFVLTQLHNAAKPEKFEIVLHTIDYVAQV